MTASISHLTGDDSPAVCRQHHPRGSGGISTRCLPAAQRSWGGPQKEQAQNRLPASDLASHLLTLHSAQSKHSATLGQAEFDSKKQAEDFLVVQ